MFFCSTTHLCFVLKTNCALFYNSSLLSSTNPLCFVLLIICALFYKSSVLVLQILCASFYQSYVHCYQIICAVFYKSYEYVLFVQIDRKVLWKFVKRIFSLLGKSAYSVCFLVLYILWILRAALFSKYLGFVLGTSFFHLPILCCDLRNSVSWRAVLCFSPTITQRFILQIFFMLFCDMFLKCFHFYLFFAVSR
jgi:hypothetical protein